MLVTERTRYEKLYAGSRRSVSEVEALKKPAEEARLLETSQAKLRSNEEEQAVSVAKNEARSILICCEAEKEIISDELTRTATNLKQMSNAKVLADRSCSDQDALIHNRDKTIADLEEKASLLEDGITQSDTDTKARIQSEADV